MTSFTKLIQQGFMYPYRFINGRVKRATAGTDQIKPGEGAIVDDDGKKVAVFKEAGGHVITLSPVCKHLACLVDWNAAEKTWDCPCHGSRYASDGRVIHGPATKGLDRLSP